MRKHSRKKPKPTPPPVNNTTFIVRYSNGDFERHPLGADELGWIRRMVVSGVITAVGREGCEMAIDVL